MDESEIKKGTTTVGLVYKNGVVIAADKRASLGYLIANKNVDKIFDITTKIAMTIAGNASDGQMLAKYLKAEMVLYKINSGIEPSLSVAANLMGNILFNQGKSWTPYLVQLILGGKDDEGYALYTMDPLGSVIKENRYNATGSGSPTAFGVMEAGFSNGMTKEQAVQLAVKAINAAISRDLGTGDGIDVVVIDDSGLARMQKQEIVAVTT